MKKECESRSESGNHVRHLDAYIMATDNDEDVVALLERDDWPVFFDPRLNQSWWAGKVRLTSIRECEVHDTH